MASIPLCFVCVWGIVPTYRFNHELPNTFPAVTQLVRDTSMTVGVRKLESSVAGEKKLNPICCLFIADATSEFRLQRKKKKKSL